MNDDLYKSTLGLLQHYHLGDHEAAWMVRFVDLLPYKPDLPRLVRAVVKRPTLFAINPDLLASNIETSAKLLGITPEAFIKAGLKHSQVFYQRPDTLNGNIEGSAKLLGISRERLINAALKHPTIMSLLPERLWANVEESARLLDIEAKDFIRAALKQPSLFGNRPTTLRENIERSAEFLGTTTEAFTKACLISPALFYRRPDVLKANAETSAELCGIKTNKFVRSALRVPALLSQHPQTVTEKADYVKALAKAVGHTMSRGSVVTDLPTGLNYSLDYLGARLVLARLGLKSGAPSSILVTPSKEADLLIDRYVAERTAIDERAAYRERLLSEVMADVSKTEG